MVVNTHAIPVCYIYLIFTYIYHKNQPNAGKYTIHGWYGSYDHSFCYSMFSSGRHFWKQIQSCRKDSKILFAPVFYEHVPSISFTVTLQGTNISHLGKRKIIFKYALSGGYVNFLERTVFGPNHIVMISVCYSHVCEFPNLGKTLEVPGETRTASLRLEIKRCNPIEVKTVFFRYLSFASNVRFVRLLLGVFLYFDNYTVP